MKRLNKIQREVRDAFKQIGLTPKFGDDWLNIARPDGVHVEFYPCCHTTEYEVYTATYTLKGQPREFDFECPFDIDEFVDTVCEILEHERGEL